MANPSDLPVSEAHYHQVSQFVGDDVTDVFHGFFGRNGGVSTGIHSSLNCGEGSDDNPGHVTQNRKIVAGAAGAEVSKMLSLYQMHSDKCVTVDQPWLPQDKPKADAMVTDKAGLLLGVLTADCAPVLFHGRKSDGAPVIGAAHAGWRGAFGGVLQSTVGAMQELGAEISSLKACVGPCIGKASYEVDQGFFEEFVKREDEYERFFGAASHEAHYMFDLAGFCAFTLARAGLKHVYIKDLDTYFNEEDFFSYRRTTHRQEDDYGRQISTIMIK